jgi:hypothetical protein
MIDYYTLTEKIKDTLLADPFIKTVTKGGLDDIANVKQQEYALAHVMVNSCSANGSALTYNLSVICMDIVDISKKETTDEFRGNDNEDDVLNTMLIVQVGLYEELRRGTLFTEHYVVEDAVSIEPFTDRFEDKVAGWTMTVDVVVPNQTTICR